MEQNDYFEMLFEMLSQNNLVPESNDLIVWRIDFQKYFEKAGFDKSIIREIKAEFGIGMENVILINCKKSFLIHRCYNSISKIESIKASVCFTVLGCLLDALIDMENNLNKEIAVRKVNWQYCSEYFYKGIDQKENSVIDKLFEMVGKIVFSYRYIFPKAYKSIVELLKKTSESELFVISDNTNVLSIDNVTNKSILFSVISTQICIPDFIEESAEVAYNIGSIFTMIDDMCDLYEDAEVKQKNMLQILLSKNNITERQAVQYMIDQIIENLNLLRQKANEELYQFILSETKEWIMSRNELRERVWKNNG